MLEKKAEEDSLKKSHQAKKTISRLDAANSRILASSPFVADDSWS